MQLYTPTVTWNICNAAVYTYRNNEIYVMQLYTPTVTIKYIVLYKIFWFHMEIYIKTEKGNQVSWV